MLTFSQWRSSTLLAVVTLRCAPGLCQCDARVDALVTARVIVLRYARQLVWVEPAALASAAQCASASPRHCPYTIDTKICIRRFGTGNESVRQSTSSGIAPFDNCPH